VKENTNLSKNAKKSEGTLLWLDFINSLVYSPEWKKMTRNDKRIFIRNTQWQIIDTYKKVFTEETGRSIDVSGNGTLKEVELILKRKVVDSIF
jgi:ABC-type transporter MlaC component